MNLIENSYYYYEFISFKNNFYKLTNQLKKSLLVESISRNDFCLGVDVYYG